jgi:uncharacterized membrane-anchored protein
MHACRFENWQIILLIGTIVFLFTAFLPTTSTFTQLRGVFLGMIGAIILVIAYFLKTPKKEEAESKNIPIPPPPYARNP